jgi:hypothetical protein
MNNSVDHQNDLRDLITVAPNEGELPIDQDVPVEQEFNEYNDPDATACACGDYNTFEEGQCFGEE